MGLVVTMGEAEALSALQKDLRVPAVIFVALLAVQISECRSLGQPSSFDHVVTDLLGASAVICTVIASLVIVPLHRLLTWACVRSLRLEPLVVGVGQKLFRDGRLNESQFFTALVKRTEPLETVRGEARTQGLGKVNIATVECNPQIHQRRKETHAAVATRLRQRKCVRRRCADAYR
jgi:uncharacterized membrane protein YcaP (DUF421 family)